MPDLLPPPVPQKLREMLKDYPEYIAGLQQSLIRLIEKPLHGTPPFERAIWLLEGQLETFYSEARAELKAAEASGDVQAIQKAKEKEFTIGYALGNMWMPDLVAYFEAHKDAFE